MKVPGRGASAPPPVRQLVRIAASGLAFVLAILAAGWFTEFFWVGRNEEGSRNRVAADVRTSIDEMARGLREMAPPLANADVLVGATAGDTQLARRLFDTAEMAVARGDANELAITAYAADARPIAWAGRPSELQSDRLSGDEAWFFTQQALGPRLVYVTPVLRGPDRQRVGTIAAERSLASRAAMPARASPAQADLQAPGTTFQFESQLAPVTLDFAAGTAVPPAFDVLTPTGRHLLTASVSSEDLARVQARWRRASVSLALFVCAVTIFLLAGPLLDWRNRTGPRSQHVRTVVCIALSIVAGRLLIKLASPADWSDAPIFSGAAYASPSFGTFLASPFDFVMTALSVGGLVALGAFLIEAWRVSWRLERRALSSSARALFYLAAQLAAGLGVAALLLAHQRLLRDTIANTTLDLIHFSFHPWNSARLALQVGLIVWHATVLALGVTTLRAAAVMWRIPRHSWHIRLATIAAWALPLLTWQVAGRRAESERLPEAIALIATVVLALAATRLKARYRHGSQAFRLTVLTLALVVPAAAFYPSVFRLAWQAKLQLVETRYAPQALNQRSAIQSLLQQSLEQIDATLRLPELLTSVPSGDEPVLTDRAFEVWRGTAMAAYPLTSSVELYGVDGRLVSRFAFNLPDDLSAAPQSQERICQWEIYEEVAPFFAEERRVLHAGRAVCVRDAVVGSIVVHAVLDYANLPFISSRNPYVELLRPTDSLRDEGLSGGDVQYVVYGWSRVPLYASADSAWPLDDAIFNRIADTRAPLWTKLQRGADRFDVYLMNDRGGIYALGFPTVSVLGHLVNLA